MALNSNLLCVFKTLLGAWAMVGMLGGRAVAQNPEGYLPGEELVLDFGCVACHQVDAGLKQRLEGFSAPDLSAVGGRLSSKWMQKFLQRPRGLRPHGKMPNVLAALSSEEREQAAWELSGFLASLGGPLPQEVVGLSEADLEAGRQLFHSVGCVACHKPFEDSSDLELSLAESDALARQDQSALAGGQEEESPDPLAVAGMPSGMLAPRDLALPNLVPMTAVVPLAEFLLDPLAVRPSGQMPNMGLSEKEAHKIALYLLRGQLDLDPVASPGLAVDVLKGNFNSFKDLSNCDAVSHVVLPRVGLGDLPYKDNFGLRFSGELSIPAAGEWTFFLQSDDGSFLWIDGQQVIDNWGNHAPRMRQVTLELAQGPHSIGVHYFEAGGGQEVRLEWQGPDQARAEVPESAFSHLGGGLRPPLVEPIDPERIGRGIRRFTSLGCGVCHTTGTDLDEPPLSGQVGAPPLGKLAGGSGAGCLKGTEGHGPRWSFEQEQHAALKEFLDAFGELTPQLPPDQKVARQMKRMGCVHCHRRGGRGGVHPWNRDYFTASPGVDLGDEGRLPPGLDGVGGKLQLDALRGVLSRAERVRPYMSTRMPQYGEENVGWLADAFAALDPDLPLSGGDNAGAEHLVLGVQLLGTEEGLGCIQCHDFSGTPSLGIRAVDLASMGQRIKPGWFEALLRDPGGINMNTRMAELFVDGKSLAPGVLGGDPEAQIRAVWQALSLGTAMPVPPGLVAPDADYELMPRSGVVTCGVFMRGMSPRTLVVGFPELLHYAFDMQNSRLGRLWQGRFFNVRGTWAGRAGSLEMPPGAKLLELPAGMVLAHLPDALAPWPTALGREAGFSVLGRQQALGQAPVFRYGLQGVLVEETLRPVRRDGRQGFVRTLRMEAEDLDAAQQLVARIAVGDDLRSVAQGVWRVKCDGHDLELRMLESSGLDGFVVVGNELRHPAGLQPLDAASGRYGATLTWEILW